MSLKGRRAVSRRVGVGFGTAVAAFALLGSGLVAGSASVTTASGPEAPSTVTQTSPAERRDFWGAIKMANDGAFGKATNRRTAKRAERAAGRKCRRDTSHRCNTASVTTANSCGAIAFRMRNGTVVKAVSVAGQSTRRRAARVALRSCESDGHCRVVTVCTRGHS
jgi:hypothetical protein